MGSGIRYRGRLYGHERVDGPSDMTEEQRECAIDKIDGRNCGPIREEGRKKLSEIPGLFECDGSIARLKPDRGSYFGSREEYIDISGVPGTEGYCGDVIQDYSGRIRTMLHRLNCDTRGNLSEKLGLGKAGGGRFYNPCNGGSC